VTHRTTASPSDSPCQESDSGGGRRLGGSGGAGEEGDDSGRAGGRAGSGRVRVWGCRGGRPPPAIDEVGEGGRFDRQWVATRQGHHGGAPGGLAASGRHVMRKNARVARSPYGPR
jgi:hypothetical protein